METGAEVKRKKDLFSMLLIKQFSHDFVESGQLDKYIPTKENLLQEEVAQFRGDYFKMACDAILKAWNEK